MANLSFSGIHTGSNVCLKCVRTRLAAGLRPDPLGEFKCSPDPLAAMRGLLLRGRGGENGEEREREEREAGSSGEGREGKGREGREGMEEEEGEGKVGRGKE